MRLILCHTNYFFLYQRLIQSHILYKCITLEIFHLLFQCLLLLLVNFFLFLLGWIQCLYLTTCDLCFHQHIHNSLHLVYKLHVWNLSRQDLSDCFFLSGEIEVFVWIPLSYLYHPSIIVTLHVDYIFLAFFQLRFPNTIFTFCFNIFLLYACIFDQSKN